MSHDEYDIVEWEWRTSVQQQRLFGRCDDDTDEESGWNHHGMGALNRGGQKGRLMERTRL